MLDKVTVNEVVVFFMAIAGVILAFLELKKRLGFGATGKKVADVERRTAVLENKVEQIQKDQANAEKGYRIIMKALLAILPEGNPVKGEIQQYLLDK